MIRLEPKTFDVPRAAGSFGPFAAPERKRTIAPDDLQLFRLLCGFAGVTPGKMFRKLVREEARRQIGIGRADPDAKAKVAAEANKVFAAATPAYAPPVRLVPRYPVGVSQAALHGGAQKKRLTGDQS